MSDLPPVQALVTPTQPHSPSPSACHMPTVVFLGRLTLAPNLQITPSDELTRQLAEFVIYRTPVLSQVFIYTPRTSHTGTVTARCSAHLKALPVRHPDNHGLLSYFLPGLFAACHQHRWQRKTVVRFLPDSSRSFFFLSFGEVNKALPVCCSMKWQICFSQPAANQATLGDTKTATLCR